MNYLSLCSGIEAATVAWHPLGWNPAAFSEIEAFPSAVLAHRFPQVPNLGDMTKYKGWNNVICACISRGQDDQAGRNVADPTVTKCEQRRGIRGDIGDGENRTCKICGRQPIDLLVGGTPCQSFSVAGLRKGMDDPRGNLALVFCGIIEALRPRWVVWENVPGVLSSNAGRDFGAFLGALAELGYGWAYRILDAQYFGVPQRRRRVFVVGYLGDWRPAAAVLFERHSLSGNPPPRREKGTRTAGTIADCSNGGGANGPGRTVDSADTLVTQSLGCHRGGPDDNKAQDGFYVPEICAQAVSSKWSKGSSGPAGDEHHNLVAQTLRAEHDASEDGTRRGVPWIAFTQEQEPKFGEIGQTLGTYGGRKQGVASGSSVRRLTPRECERLQGFPDDWTNIPWRGKPESPDSPRYKAIGNSMAVPVMAWIGERIQMVENIKNEVAA